MIDRRSLIALCVAAATYPSVGQGRPASSRITLWGDSMSTVSNGYGATLKRALAGNDVYVQALGGQGSLQVAARMGALSVYVTVPEGHLPADGALVRCRPSITLLTNSNYSRTCVRCLVSERNCQLVYEHRTNSYWLGLLDRGGGGLTLQGRVRAEITTGFAGGSNPVPRQCRELPFLLNGINVLRVGANDPCEQGEAPPLVRYAKAIANQVTRRKGRLLVIGAINGSRDLPRAMGGGQVDEFASLCRLNQVRGQNQAMAAMALSRSIEFVDLMREYIARGASREIIVQGKRFHVLVDDVAVPVLKDGRHENDNGIAVATMLISKEIIRMM